MFSNNFRANVSPFKLNVNPNEPNVGVCLCGGGSRAMVAAMGQLRALKHLGLLKKTTALSTVSGGSWVGSTYSFLPQGINEDDYLGEYVANPAKLTLTEQQASPPEFALDYLHEKSIAHRINTHFSFADIAIEAIYLASVQRIPAHMIWQTMIGRRILEPYGLYTPDSNQIPTTTFTNNSDSKQQIIEKNPQLDQEGFHLAHPTTESTPNRPYLICNFSMFVKTKGRASFGDLVAGHSSPYFTGIPGKPDAEDANGLAVGGGGVENFAFNSTLTAIEGQNAIINQQRQWSLEDAIGTSSAFFAETLHDLVSRWTNNPHEMKNHLMTMDEDKYQTLTQKHSSHKAHSFLRNPRRYLKGIAIDIFSVFLRFIGKEKQFLLSNVKKLSAMIPAYHSWPVADAQKATELTQPKPNHFADGGSLENTGVGGLLSYANIDRVISFVNSTTPLNITELGIFDLDHTEIPNTRFLIDAQIPPLFGYKPFDTKEGYRPFKQTDDSAQRHNQIFEYTAFAPFLIALIEASGENFTTNVAIVKTQLKVLENCWFGIEARENIDLLMVYTTKVRSWFDQLAPEVQALMGDFDDSEAYHRFPYYNTVDKTELSPQESNLLASLTAWSVASPQYAHLFKSMYQEEHSESKEAAFECTEVD